MRDFLSHETLPLPDSWGWRRAVGKNRRWTLGGGALRQHWFGEVGVDVERANAARMYDYLLGGAHNFAVDRERADQAIAARPELVYMARANRSFLGRVVRWCVQRGVDQFLDLGSGVPTVGNVHEVAHAIDPAARVAYVDFEPVAVTHATDIINQTSKSNTVTVTRADARDPAAVLTAPTVADLLDLDRPVALLAVALLHFVEGDIADLLARYRAALAPGSVVAISHVSDDQPDPEIAAQMRAMRDTYTSSATPMVLRDHAELVAALSGFELVPPGLVDTAEWPDLHGARKAWAYGGVALVR